MGLNSQVEYSQVEYSRGGYEAALRPLLAHVLGCSQARLLASSLACLTLVPKNLGEKKPRFRVVGIF